MTLDPSLSYHVRHAVIDDYDRLRPVFDEAELFHRQALPHIFRVPEGTFPSLDLYREMVETPGSAVLVAEEKGKLIGFVTVREASAAPEFPALIDRQVAMVDMLAVQTDRRHHGVGRALMQATHVWALARGLHDVQLEVWEFNQPAITFYEALGYRGLFRMMERTVL